MSIASNMSNSATFLRRARHAIFIVALALGIAPTVWAQAPVNDSFGGLTIPGSSGVVTASNVGATGQPGEPAHAGNPATASVWWTWVAPDSGTVTVETLGSDFDTVLGVYTGDAVNALTLIANNDDAPGLATSLLTFPAIQGTTYRIAVDGYSGANGTIRLSLSLPVTPTPPHITFQPASQTVPDNVGSNVTFAVTVTGSFPRFFTWQKDGQPLPNGSKTNYTINNAVLADAGNYRVIITNYLGSVTSSVAVLTVRAGLGQDAFAGRVLLTGTTNTVTAHNVGATFEIGEPMHANVPSDSSIWWTWTAPRNGLTRVDTAGSLNTAGAKMDTVLAVYTGTALNQLALVTANNDEIPGELLTSKVYFRAVAGTTYQIAVAGLKDPSGAVAVGDITLNLSQSPDNDFFANALPFPADLSTVVDNNTGATIETGEPAHAGNPGGKSVWWSWTAPGDGAVVLDTAGSSIDTVLAVYTGTAVNALTLVGEDDNRSDDGTSLVRFLARAGMTYFFAVDGFSGTNGVDSGEIILNLNPTMEINDDFSDRTTLTGSRIHVTSSNVGASKEDGEPNHGGNAGGRSVWWTWTAHATGPVIISTSHSSFDTALAVYTGTNLGSLKLIGENDDADPTDPSAGSLVQFQGLSGQTYQIAVDGYRAVDGYVGEGEISLSLVQATPPAPGENDLFANRFSLTGQTNVVTGINTNATEEAGEPNHAGNDGGRSIWWSWVAPASAPVRFTTIGSSFDTVLGVYQGSSVDNLTRIASDDDSGGDGVSAVTFVAVQGVEYQIAVDGFNDGTGAESGLVVLTVHQYPSGVLHANDDFENAPPISDQFPTVQGVNIGASRQPGEPAHGAAPQGHSVWWTWTASTDGPVTITTTNSQFDTILAVYTGNALDALTLVAENDDIGDFALQSSVTFQAVADTLYHIAVDGYGSEIGMISLTVAPGSTEPAAPQIQQAPEDQTRFAGGGGGGVDVAFRVVATGSSPLAYQWLRNGIALDGATNSILTLINASASDAGAYQVTVSNDLGSVTSGRADFTWSPSIFNDNFENRILIVGSSNVVHGSLLGATKEANEPHHGGEVGGRSVWWRWIAPTNGPVEMNTFGSSVDTLLAVYQGTNIGNLTLVQENNDVVPQTNAASRVRFTAVAGQEYQIAVDSQKTTSAFGSVFLTVRPQQPLPLILVQPHSPNAVPINGVLQLNVVAQGQPSQFNFQWYFNGNLIPSATNSSYILSPSSRASSGSYSVSIANDTGIVTSSNAIVRVQVPQLLLRPQIAAGTIRLSFSDPDGTLSSDPSLFEVQYTATITSPTTSWISASGTISVSNGKLIYEEPAGPGAARRFYRIIAK